MQPDAPALIWDAHHAAGLVREFITVEALRSMSPTPCCAPRSSASSRSSEKLSTS